MSVAWTDIEPEASAIFQIWTSGGDLEFAKEAWGQFIAAGLAKDGNNVMRTKAQLRLLALRQIYGEFCREKWDEPADDELLYCAMEMEFDAFALGLLARNLLDEEEVLERDESDLRDAAITVVCEAVREEVATCLRKAYGGAMGLYNRLSRTAMNEDEDEQFGDDQPTGNNLAAYSFVQNNCNR